MKTAKALAHQLYRRQRDLDVRLLMNNVEVIRDGKAEPITLGTENEAWFAISFFREWLAEQLREIDLVSEVDDQTSAIHYKAHIYRAIQRRPSSYLRCSVLEQKLAEANIWIERAEFQKYLDLVKDELAKIIDRSDLLCNNLMLDVDDLQIQYLTCAELTDEDIPWKVTVKKRKVKTEPRSTRSSTTSC